MTYMPAVRNDVSILWLSKICVITSFARRKFPIQKSGKVAKLKFDNISKLHFVKYLETNSMIWQYYQAKLGTLYLNSHTSIAFRLLIPPQGTLAWLLAFTKSLAWLVSSVVDLFSPGAYKTGQPRDWQATQTTSTSSMQKSHAREKPLFFPSS